MRQYWLHTNTLNITWLVLFVLLFAACGGATSGTPTPGTPTTLCPLSANHSIRTSHSGYLAQPGYLSRTQADSQSYLFATAQIISIGPGAHTDDGGTLSFDSSSGDLGDSTDQSLHSGQIDVTMPPGSLPKNPKGQDLTTLELMIDNNTNIRFSTPTQICAYATAQPSENRLLAFKAMPTGLSPDGNAVIAHAITLQPGSQKNTNIVEYVGLTTQQVKTQLTLMVGNVPPFGPFAINPSTQVDGFPCPISIGSNQAVDATVQFIKGSETVLTLINPDKSTGTLTTCTPSTPTL